MIETARFHDDGYLCPIPVLTEDEVSVALDTLTKAQEKFGGRLPPFINAKPHLLLPLFWDLIRDARILDPVESILGPDLLCYGSSFIIKPAQSHKFVAWHQDATYWGLSSPKAVTAWIALTPSTRRSGCVRVLAGSHTEILAHQDSHDRENLLGRGEELVTQIDEGLARDLVLAPGQMSLHDSLIVHGSSPNQDRIDRIGFAARYIPASTSPVVSKNASATLVRGQNTGTFRLEQAPTGLFDPDAMKRHRQVFRSGMETVMDGKLNP